MYKTRTEKGFSNIFDLKDQAFTNISTCLDLQILGNG